MPNDAGINAPFRGPASSGAGGSATSLQSRPLVLAVLALMGGAVVLLFWPGLQLAPRTLGADSSETSKHTGSVPAATAPKIDSSPAEAPLSPASNTPTVDGVNSTPMSAAGAMPSVPVDLRAAVESPVDSAIVAAVAPAKTAPATVSFKTTGPSWIQVTDAKGAVVLKKLMGAGESATASGALPLSVLVGRADATAVEIGGKPFDITPVTRENIARFEVRP